MKKTYWLISSLFLVGSAFANSSLVIDVDESNFDVDQTELVTKDLESIQAREDAFSLGSIRGERRRPGPAPRPGAPRPGGPGHGGPGGPGHGGPGHGGGHGGPVNYAGWYPAVGQNCAAYCGSIRLNVGYSPEGTQCASGEVLPLSAQQVGVAQVYGCWGSGCTGLTDYVRGAFSVGNYCYMPRQKQDRDRTDITVACYCQ